MITMEVCCRLVSKFGICLIFLVFIFINCCDCQSEDSKSSAQGFVSHRFKLEGKVTVSGASEEWMSSVRILVDGGQYLGLLKPDGSFSISVPSGSYIVEATHPTYLFDPARVEINSKGKIRARMVNHIQPSAMHSLAYPLRFKSRGHAPYFQRREQWRITDFIFSPMVMMMFFPLVLMFLLPKLINTQDPETQREMQQSMNMLQPQQNLPDAAEMLTKWFGGGGGSSDAAKKSVTRSRTARNR